MSEVKLHNTTDAEVWADEFNRILVSHGEQPIDPAVMIGWFANAIMVGADHTRWNMEKENSALKSKLSEATEKMGRMEKALEKITGGVDHALGIKASPEFYECLDWAQSIAREALSDIKNSGGSK